MLDCFDLNSRESAISSVICGVTAIVFGALAMIGVGAILSPILGGAAVGTGIWSLVYGIMAVVKS